MRNEGRIRPTVLKAHIIELKAKKKSDGRLSSLPDHWSNPHLVRSSVALSAGSSPLIAIESASNIMPCSSTKVRPLTVTDRPR